MSLGCAVNLSGDYTNLILVRTNYILSLLFFKIQKSLKFGETRIHHVHPDISRKIIYLTNTLREMVYLTFCMWLCIFFYFESIVSVQVIFRFWIGCG